jgi:predicted  nucleic acid-binding Zn-ribbon protein
MRIDRGTSMGSDSVGMTAALYGALALLLLAVLLALWQSGFFRRLLGIVEEMLFSNWQLALLGAAAVALSLASGYTTFDGLRNFTSSPLLSALVAFGIQGVMLIVAWLIGETFATGMSRVPQGRRLSAGETAIGMGLGIALTGLVFCWVLIQYGAVGFARGADSAPSFRADWGRLADVSLYFAMALALLALVAFSFRRGGDVAQPYVQSVRLIARNAVLWVMLLAAMSASVLFSFDSHFNGIFPAEARARAAEIRTLNQVAGVVADTGERAQKVQMAETERLFEADGWKAYDAQLTKLAVAARSSQAEIEAYFVRHMEQRQRGIGEQQERIAGAERSQTALLRKRDELEAELQRIEPSIGALEAELARAQASYDATAQAIAAKHIDASAEDGGVEGTLKPGKGPIWRRRMSEIDELQRRLTIVEEPRLKEAQRRRDASSARIVSLKRELATIVGEVAKYKGQIAAAEHRIKTARPEAGAAQGGRADPDRALTDFESARAAFRRQPDADKLAALQMLCSTLVGALSATPVTQEQVRGIDCDPKSAAEAAARVFALNAGLIAFRERCAGGAKLPQAASTGDLLTFGRQCLQDSGLVSQEAADLGARLQAIEMNRDDKAHRFVVTWNAFLDGNRLAYLALTLAIGIDALVFAAGLFGAAAARSPLSDLPSPKARSAEQLEAVVKNALGAAPRQNAELVLAAMKPAHGDADRRAEIELAPYDADTARRIRKVLVAGSSIGAVERTSSEPQGERYLVRPELFEYLSIVANTACASDRQHASRSRLTLTVGAALGLDRQRNADGVLHPIEPTNRRQGNERQQAEVQALHARSSIAASSQQNHLLTDGRIGIGGNDSPHEPDDGLADHIRYDLATAMGLTPAAIDRLWQVENVEAALKHRVRSYPELHDKLRLAEAELRDALAQAQEVLATRLGSDGRSAPLLRQVAAAIERKIPALAMLRELEKLILELEEAHSEGRLGEDEHLLLSRLRTLASKASSATPDQVIDVEPMDARAPSHRKSALRQPEHLTEAADAPTHPAEDNREG